MSQKPDAPEEVLSRVIELLVGDPGEVRVESTTSAGTAVLDIYVRSEDVGIVLGRRGAHADALRTIFKAVYSRMGKRLYLQVLDSDA